MVNCVARAVLRSGAIIYQPGFFDESERLSHLSQLRHSLERLKRYIDFEVFRAELSVVFARSVEPIASRKPYDVVLMLEILILQRSFNLSDEQSEYQISDRLSFMCFLDLRLCSKIPDFTTVWRLREALTKARADKRLFERITEELPKSDALTETDAIVDASIVAVPRQRNMRE